MLSDRAFIYHKQNYDIFGQFDRGLSPAKYRLILMFFLLIYITGIAFIIKLLMKSKIAPKKMKGEEIVNFIFSINQDIIYKALSNLGLTFPSYNFITQDTGEAGLNHFSSKFVLLCAIANAGRTYRELKNARTDIVLYNNAIRIMKLCGLELIYGVLIDEVKVIIQYNDHTPYCVLLHEMAEARGVKAVYIQHAPVSERFPPLYHDLNVLFSQDSVGKYKTLSDTIKKFVLFDVRFVAWDSYSDQKGKGILICPNKLDDMKIVKEFAKELSSTHTVTIRPHPADGRDWTYGDIYGVSSGRTIWADMVNTKHVITNESAVILEAIYADRLCYKCAFFSNSIDNYGFLRTGLLLHEYFDVYTTIRDIVNDKVTYNKKIFSYFAGETNAKEQKINLLRNEILHLRG